MKQAELAKQAGISASYLNLIEHNRRRIGGKTLLHIAEALQTEPTALSMGSDASLLQSLEMAAKAPVGTRKSVLNVDLERVEEFAGRFPGWAGLLAGLDAKRLELEQLVAVLTERLANDPGLAEALHEVISTVTSIRSASSILVDTRDLEPEWQMRFHRNLNEDSARLASGAEALMKYLESAPEKSAHIVAPTDEVERFFAENGFHFPALEHPEAHDTVEALLAQTEMIESEEALHFARTLLHVYVEDARLMPLPEVSNLIARRGMAPETLAKSTKQPLARVLRRLALLPDDLTGPTGFICMDNAGRVMIRKPVLGFKPPRSGVGCALWPLNESLTVPERPILTRLRHDQSRMRAYTIAEQVGQAGFDTPGLRRGYMLLVPDSSVASSSAADEVCGICGQSSCPAAT